MLYLFFFSLCSFPRMVTGHRATTLGTSSNGWVLHSQQWINRGTLQFFKLFIRHLQQMPIAFKIAVLDGDPLHGFVSFQLPLTNLC